MTELERYLFDLRGYLIVRNVLSEEELQEINDVIDGVLPAWYEKAQANFIETGWGDGVSQGYTNPGTGRVSLYVGRLLDWGEPIRRLVGHKRILPYLLELLGPSPRLDHQYAILTRAVSASMPLHGGATPHSAYGYYNYKDQRFFCGFVVVSFALTDAPPGAGGFCCIPGSHKSNLPLPEGLINLDDPDECIAQIPVRKGDVILFPEALTHGTLKWTADHERRAVLFKYAPRHIVWENEAPFVTYDYEWEEHQKELLRAPHLESYDYEWEEHQKALLKGPHLNRANF
jgi:hypothetical protein